ncbi:UNVERIFIED_CONTAM: Acetylcholinesterase-1 [Trichonephila clavipes]
MKTKLMLLVLGIISKVASFESFGAYSEILGASAYANAQTFSQSTILNRIIHTPSGPVQGIATQVLSIPVQTYLGIPYAKPPLGDLRFRKPVSVDAWTETLIANRMPPACMQYTTYPFPWYDSNPDKSEDCLYLNIWAPVDATEGSKKAVIFWIYGGGPFGSNRRDGSALAAVGDVIFVSPNFRLGLFGFLTTATQDLPGNYGLWDLLEALKWVRGNIESFGGDPNQITLQGESSGSFIVSMFCISPLTEGLFSKAILESGSTIILQTNPAEVNVKDSQRLAKAVGCATDENTIQSDTKTVVDCLRGKDGLYLAQVQYSFNPASDLYFMPQYGDELLPNLPSEDIRKGHFHQVPLLIGDNHNEGVNLITYNQDVFGFFGEKNPLLNKTYAKYLLKTSFFGSSCSTDDVASYYLDDISDDDPFRVRQQLYTGNGEITLTCPTTYFGESYANRSNDVYFYLFNHRPRDSPWAPWMGATHYDEVQFVFGEPFLDSSRYTVLEFDLSKKMIQYWTNFAKYGSPSSSFDWPKYSSEYRTVMILDIGLDGIRLGINPSFGNYS